MAAQLMVRPSSLMYDGIQLREFGNIHLFRFNEELQFRMEELLERRKANSLTPEEEVEYAGICELERIFTFINAQLSTQAKWCPIDPDNWYDKEPDTSANTAIPQNL